MLRVRGVRSDFCIYSCRIEPLLCDRRIVVEMDQIVRDTGMLRLACKYWLEDRGAFELIA